MILKKVAHKARIGAKVLRNEGPVNFGIRALQKLQTRSIEKQPSAQKDPIYTRVKYEDAIRADLNTPPPRWHGTTKAKLQFNWLMPPPGKGSGGHINIFRFIKFLEEAGHESRIYLYTQHGGGPISDIRAIMGDSYPRIKADMQWLKEGEEMAPADGIFATSWDTAYPAYNSQLTARRFYFVQDFEPYFYAVGSLYALAENTYKFGFYGVTAGGWLSSKLAKDYGMRTDHFNFGSDEKLYTHQNTGLRKEILFYCRPYTERRGFEIGMMALDLFHKQHPDYTINLVGWDVSNYQIPFPYTNLKILEVEELSELYNKCVAGLVLSFTNMSLLPLELLGCGTIPLVNDGDNNRLVSNNPYIVYSANDPVSLARNLSEIVTRQDIIEHATAASQSVGDTSWQASGAKFVEIIERETKNSE